MKTLRTRRQRGFTLLEAIIVAALLGSLALGSLQFVSMFYRTRLADGISAMLLMQSARAQAEFRYLCQNATAIRMYASKQARDADYAEGTPSQDVQPSGNYFEADYVDQSTGQALTVGIEYNSTQNALVIWSYNTGQPQPRTNPVTLCANYISDPAGQTLAFGFDYQVPFLKYRLGLPANTYTGGVNKASGEYYDITAYAKSLYMR